MRIGTRIISPREVTRYDAELLQISVYFGQHGGLNFVRRAAHRCRRAGIPYVLHPIGFSLLQEDSLKQIELMAPDAGEAIILHDECAPDGEPLAGELADRYGHALERLSIPARLSLENAADSAGAPLFWTTFASSITLDIGHLEAAGLHSVEFVNSLPESLIAKIDYVHIHHNGPLRRGITDHWPLKEGCRELQALEALLRRRDDLGVILEINEHQETGQSLALIRSLRHR